MKTNVVFDFVVDKENKTIAIKREFDASRVTVWNAFTQSEILDQWWAPKPWKAKTKTMDFEPGGFWHYAMVGPAGEEHWALMTYLTVQPQQGFSGIDVFADEKANVNEELPKSTWDVRFTDKGDQTLVEYLISFDDVKQLDEQLKMGFKEGFTAALENLDAWLEVKHKNAAR